MNKKNLKIGYSYSLVYVVSMCLFFIYGLKAQVLTPFQKGEKKYVHNEFVRPGQIRIAQAGVQAKIEEAVKKGYVDKKNGTYFDLKFDNGRSIIPLDNALPTVKIKDNTGREWLVLLDGHHDYMSNKAVGGETVYVELKDDLSAIPSNKVWKALEEKNYIYAKNLNGKKIIPLPTSFNALENDPYRYFVKMAMWECKSPETAFGQSKAGTQTLQYPLAVKWKDKQFNPHVIEKSGIKYIINPPYIEFIVADALYKYAKTYGFDYRDGDEKNPQKFAQEVEFARHILANHPVAGFNFIPIKIQSSQVNDGNICGYSYLAQPTRGVNSVLRKLTFAP